MTQPLLQSLQRLSSDRAEVTLRVSSLASWTSFHHKWPLVEQQSLHRVILCPWKHGWRTWEYLALCLGHFGPGGPDSFPWPAIFPPLLGETERKLYRCHHSSIRTHQQRAVPHVSTYNFWILLIDGTATSASHLKTIQLQQDHGYNLEASVRAIMAHKASGRLCYFHTSTNNYHLLPILASVKESRGLALTVRVEISGSVDRPCGQPDAWLSLAHHLFDQRQACPVSWAGHHGPQ